MQTVFWWEGVRKQINFKFLWCFALYCFFIIWCAVLRLPLKAALRVLVLFALNIVHLCETEFSAQVQFI